MSSDFTFAIGLSPDLLSRRSTVILMTSLFECMNGDWRVREVLVERTAVHVREHEQVGRELEREIVVRKREVQ